MAIPGPRNRILRRSRLRSHTEHDNACEGAFALKLAVDLPRSFFGPEVADSGREMGGIPEIFPGDGDFSVGGAAIQQDDGAA
jgi:hypothetical protein